MRRFVRAVCDGDLQSGCVGGCVKATMRKRLEIFREISEKCR